MQQNHEMTSINTTAISNATDESISISQGMGGVNELAPPITRAGGTGPAPRP